MRLETGRVYLVGSAEECDIVIRSPTVAKAHAEVRPISQTHFMVRDLGTPGGTFVRRERVYRARFSAGEDIGFGKVRTRLRDLQEVDWVLDDPSALHSQSSPEPLDRGRSYDVGASPEADIQIESARAAWLEGALSFAESGWRFRGHGTRQNTLIRPGQEFRIGTTSVSIDADDRLVRTKLVDNRLDAVDLSFTLPSGLRLLDDVSFPALSGQVIGVMGPSGSGKSTLLRALVGALRPIGGDVYLFGRNVAAHPDLLRAEMGYVPQHDLVRSELTVIENLRYAAQLRLPPDWPRRAIDDRLDDVIRMLFLQDARDRLAGRLSGGQRKRVQLGIELVTEPSVLLADEPCSGLSAWDTDNVMRHLRGLGDRGRTILVTIHSPDVEALEMMDRLLLLDRGGVVAYFGPAYPDSLTYFSRCEPSPYQSPKLIFDVLERRKRDGSDDRKTPPHRWRQIYEATPMREECVSQVQESLVGAEPERPDAVDRASPRPSYRRQLVVQTRRRALQQWRDKMDVAITLGQAPILALSFFAVFLARSYGQPTFIPLTRYSAEALGPILVLAVLTAVWFGATKGIVEFPGAWQEYRHERLTFLRIPEFVLPRFVVLGALVGAQVALFAWTFGLLFVLLPDWLNPDLSTLSSPGGWAALLRFARFSLDLSLLLWLVALAAIGTSFFLSTFLRTRGAAAALLPCFLIAQTLLAGVNPLIHKMPEGARTVAGAMASRWGYEAMALLCDRHLAAKGPRGETKTPFTSRARLDPRGEVLARTLAAAPPTPTELAAFRSIEPILEGVTGGYVQSYRSNLARLEGHPGEASQVVAEGYLLVGLLAIANTEELEQPALRAAWQALMRRAPELASFRPGHGAFCWRSLALLAVVTLVLACGMIRLRESSPRW